MPSKKSSVSTFLTLPSRGVLVAPPAQGVLVLLQKMRDLKMGWKKSSTREGDRYYRGIIGSEVMVDWILRHISFA